MPASEIILPFPPAATVAQTNSPEFTPPVEPVSPAAIPRDVAPDSYIDPVLAPTWEELAARFRPVFARIAEAGRNLDASMHFVSADTVP